MGSQKFGRLVKASSIYLLTLVENGNVSQRQRRHRAMGWRREDDRTRARICDDDDVVLFVVLMLG